MKLIKNIIIVSTLGVIVSACNSTPPPAESIEEPVKTTTIITPAPAPAPAPKAEPVVEEPKSKLNVRIGRDKDGNVTGGVDADIEK